MLIETMLIKAGRWTAPSEILIQLMWSWDEEIASLTSS